MPVRNVRRQSCAHSAGLSYEAAKRLSLEIADQQLVQIFVFKTALDDPERLEGCLGSLLNIDTGMRQRGPKRSQTVHATAGHLLNEERVDHGT